MSVLCKFVDEGVQSLWDDGAAMGQSRDQCQVVVINAPYLFLYILMIVIMSYLVVSTGLGSKLPSESTEAFFSVLEQKLAST